MKVENIIRAAEERLAGTRQIGEKKELILAPSPLMRKRAILALQERDPSKDKEVLIGLWRTDIEPPRRILGVAGRISSEREILGIIVRPENFSLERISEKLIGAIKKWPAIGPIL